MPIGQNFLFSFYQIIILENYRQKISMLIQITLIWIIQKQIFSVEYPIISLNSAFSVPNSISLGQDTCQQIQITSNRIYRLGKSNVIGSWLKDGSGYIQNSVQQIEPWAQRIYHMNIEMDQSQIIFYKYNTKNLYSLDVNNLIQKSNYLLSSGFLPLTSAHRNDTKYIITSSNYGTLSTHTTYVIQISNGSLSAPVTAIIDGMIKSKIDPQGRFQVLWNKKGKFWLNRVGFSPPSMLLKSTTDNLVFLYENEVQISPDGTRMVLQFDNLKNLLVLRLEDNITVTVLQNISMPFVIKKLEFIDQNQKIAIFHDSNISYYYVDSMNLIKSIFLANISFENLLQVDRYNKKIFECKLGEIIIYNFQCPDKYYFSSPNCVICDPVIQVQHCLNYDMFNGNCTECQSGYNLNSNSCIQIAVIGNQTDNSTNASVIGPSAIANLTSINTTVNGTINIDDNSSTGTNTTVQQQNNGTKLLNLRSDQNQPIVPSQSQSLGNIQSYQAVADLTIDGYKIIVPIVFYITFFIQVIPLAQFFIRFINYWNLACLYLFLDITTPPFLQKANSIVYESMSSSLTAFLGVQLPQVNLTQEQMNNAKFNELGIQIDFLNANLQNLIFFIISFALTYAVVYGRKIVFKPGSYFYKLFDWEIYQIIFAQSIGLINSFVLPAKQLITDFYQFQFSDKINLLFHIVFIFISLSIPFVYLWFKIENNNKKQLKFTTVSNTIAQEKLSKLAKKTSIQSFLSSSSKIKKELFATKQESLNFWYYFINVSISFLIILPTAQPFIIINFFVLFQIIRASFHVKQYRINTIVLSLYLPLFHLGYGLLIMFSSYNSQKLNSYFGLICILSFLIGGAHQLLSLILCTLYQIFTWVKSIYLKNKIATQGNLQKQKQEQQKRADRNKKISAILKLNRNNKQITRESTDKLAIQDKLQSKDLIKSIKTIKHFKNIKFTKKKGQLITKSSLNSGHRSSIQSKQSCNKSVGNSSMADTQIVLTNLKTSVNFDVRFDQPLSSVFDKNSSTIFHDSIKEQQFQTYKITQTMFKKKGSFNSQENQTNFNDLKRNQEEKKTVFKKRQKKFKVVTQNKIRFKGNA